MTSIRRHLVSLAIALLLPAAPGVARAQHRIETYAGGGPDDVAAIAAAIGVPTAVALDASGNLFISSWSHRVFKIDTAGHLTVLAGNGVGGFGGDGGPARDARLYAPTGVAVDGSGNVYICDWGNQRIRRVDAATLEITTVAGGGPVDGDAVLATAVAIAGPNGVAVDGSGQIYIAETGANRIRKVDAAGTITTVATGPLNFPMAVAVDAAGNIFVADASNQRVQRVDATGAVSTVAVANFPSGVALSGGDLYITEQGGARVLKVAAGTTTTIAGTGVPGFSCAAGPATAATLSHGILGLAADASGNVFIADSFNRCVRRVDAVSGNLNTVAGNGQLTYSGDGGPALKASLTVTGFAVDGAGDLYFPDAGRIRRVTATTGVIDTLAGSPGLAETGVGIAPDGAGGWLVADFSGHRVRRIDASGTITTVAGTGVFGFSGDGAAATAARLNGPTAVAVDAAGNIFIADTHNHRVRKIDMTGTITTVAGNGTTGLPATFGPHVDGVAATSARVWNPTGLAFRDGNMYIAEQFGHRVRRVDAFGVIHTFAGGGTGGDAGPAANAALGRPTTLTFDPRGNLYITETELNTARVRRVDVSGTIETFAGTGAEGFSGDGGPATLATFAQLSPWGIAIDSQGNVFLGDRNNNRIRRVTNEVPVADAGADVIVTPGLQFTLSGQGSSDPDGDTLSYEWRDEFGSLVGTSRDETLTRPAGIHTFTLTVSDGFTSDADAVVVTMNPTVLVNIFGAGAGIVTSADGGISCASGTAIDCAESYAAGTVVTLTATPQQWSVFGGWENACAAFSTNVCSITLTSNVFVKATFNVQTFTLTAANAGGGTVTSSVGGINCGATCADVFVATTPVTLTATAEPGYRFDGWSGACTGTGLCSLTMTADQSVTATFSAIALTQLVVSPASATIGVGQLQPFKATGTFTDGPARIVSPASALEAGDQYTCALLQNGTVKCWGSVAGITSSPLPVLVAGLSDVVSLGAGTSQACAVLANGSVKCWGSGYLGDGVTSSSATPVTVSGISTATAVVVGAFNSHACVLLANGSVQCWGAGGLLGDGSFNSSPTPVQVSGITTAVAITAEGGTHTCALLADRTLRCWGGDPLGQLGDGGPLPGTESTVPVTVAGITNATAVAAGSSHTCAVVGSGAVKCWGGNFFGQLGIGTMDNDGSSSPVGVLGITTAVAIATGDFHSCALLANGSVKCWGAPSANGSAAGSGNPIPIAGIVDATALGTGDVHSCAMLASGGVKCWGLGGSGQLGDGNNQSSSTPLTVAGITTGLSVIWTSTDAAAHIDANGRAVGASQGTTTIGVAAAGSSATAALLVNNTPAGSNVSVAPIDASTGSSPATLTFSSVTQPGITSVTITGGGPAPPAGFELGTPPVYYELTTTAVFAGPITVCIDYTGITFVGPPALYHLENGVMVNRTTSVDTVNEIVCGSVTSLSPFALFQHATAPTILEVRPDLRELWPANHRLVAVTFAVDASDNSGVAPTCRIVQVTSSEPDNGQGAGDISPDWLITADLAVKLRAERSGRGSGRVYTVVIRCADGAGNSATASSSVHVPHDRRR